MQMLLMFASLASFGVAVYAWSVAATDVWLAMALIGAIGGFLLLGLAMVVGRLADLQRLPPELPENAAPPLAPESRRAPAPRPEPRRPVTELVDRREPHF
jgi:hypothetical protein